MEANCPRTKFYHSQFCRHPPPSACVYVAKCARAHACARMSVHPLGYVPVPVPVPVHGLHSTAFGSFNTHGLPHIAVAPACTLRPGGGGGGRSAFFAISQCFTIFAIVRNPPHFPAFFPQLLFACPPCVLVGALCVPCTEISLLQASRCLHTTPQFPAIFPQFLATGFDAP